MDIDIILQAWMDRNLFKFLYFCRESREHPDIINFFVIDIKISFVNFVNYLDTKESGDLKFFILNQIDMFDFYTRIIKETKENKTHLQTAMHGYSPGKVFENGMLIINMEKD